MSNISIVDNLAAIPKEEWNQLSFPHFPFADYEYLLQLEKSGSVGENTGWSPRYLTARQNGKLEGASYLYSKAHSYGEYIFDWAWAEAYQRYRVPYYPKLLSMTPFTPATGPKLLMAERVDRERVASDLIASALEQMESAHQSSLHYLFLEPSEIAHFEKAGFLLRHSFQYHWTNPGYAGFEDFLSALRPRKRKQIARERAQLAEEGLTLRALSGEALTREHALLFYRFYLATIGKMGAMDYLTEEFYTGVFEAMRDNIVLFWAEKQQEPIAGALCYFKGETLYGRYWGANQEVRNLHFELCYYQPIEWAIQKGLKRFEAGAQGEHKIARGFLPTLTYSAHWIKHPQFREAISRFIDEEKAAISGYFAQSKEHSPYQS